MELISPVLSWFGVLEVSFRTDMTGRTASNQTLPVLRRGSSGEAVRRLQRSLVISKLLPNTGIDGIFGPATEEAVRRFQPAMGIGVDGIVGPQTWARLPQPPVLPVLRLGSTGDAVGHPQQGLTEIAKSWDVESPGPTDGTSGHARSHRCEASSGSPTSKPTGVVGDHTWYAQVGGVGRLLDFAELGGD